MQGRRQPAARGDVVPCAVRPDEVQAKGGPLKAIVDSRAAAEIEKTGAAAHGDVLAIVDPLARFRIHQRSGPTAERFGLLEQFDAKASLYRGNRGGQPGESAADNCYRGGRRNGEGRR